MECKAGREVEGVEGEGCKTRQDGASWGRVRGGFRPGSSQIHT